MDNERAATIHLWAMRVMKLSIFISFLNIIYDIVVIVAFDDDSSIPYSINIIRSVFGYISNIGLSISAILASIYGSRTLNNYNNQGIILELTHRYVNSDLKLESQRILRELENIDVPLGSPLHKPYSRFHKSVRDNLLGRSDLSKVINYLAGSFVFFNAFVFLIYYNKLGVIRQFYTKIIYMTLNVVNPVISLGFSYIVILCDNVNSILVYIGKARELLNSPTETEDTINKIMGDFADKIDQPFIYEFINLS